ncbi:MAG: hypothetical protein EOO67_17515, partial [Microbacterium sp.]
MHRLGSAVAALSFIFILTSCASIPGPGLVLDSGAVSCMPVRPGGVGVIAEQTRLEDPDSPVTLNAVELVKAKGMRLVDAFAVRNTEYLGIGSMSLDDPDDLWATRIPAVGAVIDGPDGWSIAFVLERTGEARGTAEAVAYSFTDATGQQ